MSPAQVARPFWALAASLAAATACAPAAGPRQPNVVVAVIDTLRQDRLELYGYDRPTAPRLARLGREGAVFDGISPTSWTLPAMASLLTGLHPLRHQALATEDSLSPQAATLAEALSARGWDTLAVTANGFSGPTYGLDQGFRRCVYMGDVGAGPFATGAQVNAEVRRRLDGLRPPFFLLVHYLDPHAPYERPGWSEGWYAGGRGAPVSIEELQMEAPYDRPTQLLDRARDAYDAEIRRTDEALGQMLDDLGRRGWLENALTVVVSDHGEEFQEHGRMGHGQTLYEELVRVPLVLHWPGRLAPGRQGAASLVDLAPTILGLVGHTGALPEARGQDLSGPLLQARPWPAQRPELLHLDQGGVHQLALRTVREKIVLGRHPLVRGFYDLRADPGERANLWFEEPDRVARAARELVDTYHAEVPGALPRTLLERGPRREDLAALGYVAAASPRPRGIPGRIACPEMEAQGGLGWGQEAKWTACIEASQDAAEGQLQAGWYARPDAGGRASLPVAAVLFPAPVQGGRLDLVLSGSKPDAEPARLLVRVAGAPVADEPLARAGDFSFQVPVVAPAGGRLFVELERQPPLLATRAGRAGLVDRRPRGFLWRSLCARPALAGPAAPASIIRP